MNKKYIILLFVFLILCSSGYFFYKKSLAGIANDDISIMLLGDGDSFGISFNDFSKKNTKGVNFQSSKEYKDDSILVNVAADYPHGRSNSHVFSTTIGYVSFSDFKLEDSKTYKLNIIFNGVENLFTVMYKDYRLSLNKIATRNLGIKNIFYDDETIFIFPPNVYRLIAYDNKPWTLVDTEKLKFFAKEQGFVLANSVYKKIPEEKNLIYVIFPNEETARDYSIKTYPGYDWNVDIGK